MRTTGPVMNGIKARYGVWGWQQKFVTPVVIYLLFNKG